MQTKKRPVNPLYVPYTGSDPTEPETDTQGRMTRQEWIKWQQGK
jgi:hypothetical protein